VRLVLLSPVVPRSGRPCCDESVGCRPRVLDLRTRRGLSRWDDRPLRLRRSSAPARGWTIRESPSPPRGPRHVEFFQMGSVRTPLIGRPEKPDLWSSGLGAPPAPAWAAVRHRLNNGGDRRLNRALHMASAHASAWTPRPAPPSSSAQPKAAPPKSSATSPPHYKAADPARLPHPPTRRRSRSGHERRHRSQDPDREVPVITV
jgi:hypothetical protein